MIRTEVRVEFRLGPDHNPKTCWLCKANRILARFLRPRVPFREAMPDDEASGA